jgi:ABC-type sulfate transport system substrate-binding protein
VAQAHSASKQQSRVDDAGIYAHTVQLNYSEQLEAAWDSMAVPERWPTQQQHCSSEWNSTVIEDTLEVGVLTPSPAQLSNRWVNMLGVNW